MKKQVLQKSETEGAPFTTTGGVAVLVVTDVPDDESSALEVLSPSGNWVETDAIGDSSDWTTSFDSAANLFYRVVVGAVGGEAWVWDGADTQYR